MIMISIKNFESCAIIKAIINHHDNDADPNPAVGSKCHGRRLSLCRVDFSSTHHTVLSINSAWRIM